jgi:hypothetical protein
MLTGERGTCKPGKCPSRRRGRALFQDVEVLPQMRREAVQLVRQAVGSGRYAYVRVNNRAEGNAPLTVEGLVGKLTTHF